MRSHNNPVSAFDQEPESSSKIRIITTFKHNFTIWIRNYNFLEVFKIIIWYNLLIPSLKCRKFPILNIPDMGIIWLWQLSEIGIHHSRYSFSTGISQYSVLDSHLPLRRLEAVSKKRYSMYTANFQTPAESSRGSQELVFDMAYLYKISKSTTTEWTTLCTTSCRQTPTDTCLFIVLRVWTWSSMICYNTGV